MKIKADNSSKPHLDGVPPVKIIAFLEKECIESRETMDRVTVKQSSN
jgi:hypothetical protein